VSGVRLSLNFKYYSRNIAWPSSVLGESVLRIGDIVRSEEFSDTVSYGKELVAYHQHFALLFYRREQREWVALYLRGLLTAPQWCGHTGKKDNCQAGVFVEYASRKGATFLDRRLYLPESWFDEDHKTRWQDCQIPEEIVFQTKHELAVQLVEGIMAFGRIRDG